MIELVKIACVRCGFVASANSHPEAINALQEHREYHRWHEWAVLTGRAVDLQITGEWPQ